MNEHNERSGERKLWLRVIIRLGRNFTEVHATDPLFATTQLSIHYAHLSTRKSFPFFPHGLHAVHTKITRVVENPSVQTHLVLLSSVSSDLKALYKYVIIIIIFFNLKNSWMAKGPGRRHSQTTHAAKLH